jgi:hypothetical protein
MDMAKSRLELELLAAQIQTAKAKTYGLEEWKNLIKLKKLRLKIFFWKLKFLVFEKLNLCCNDSIFCEVFEKL